MTSTSASPLSQSGMRQTLLDLTDPSQGGLRWHLAIIWLCPVARWSGELVVVNFGIGGDYLANYPPANRESCITIKNREGARDDETKNLVFHSRGGLRRRGDTGLSILREPTQVDGRGDKN
jgi:hypothetical protein